MTSLRRLKKVCQPRREPRNVYEDELKPKEVELSRSRLDALMQTEGWKKDLRPLLMARYEAAMVAIKHYDDSTHWKAVGIENHIDELMALVEGENWRNGAGKREVLAPKPNGGFLKKLLGRLSHG
jgi:hypothetical protein